MLFQSYFLYCLFLLNLLLRHTLMRCIGYWCVWKRWKLPSVNEVVWWDTHAQQYRDATRWPCLHHTNSSKKVVSFDVLLNVTWFQLIQLKRSTSFFEASSITISVSCRWNQPAVLFKFPALPRPRQLWQKKWLRIQRKFTLVKTGTVDPA